MGLKLKEITMKSRIRVIVLSLTLLLSALVLTNVNMVKAYADEDRTIRFHYTRSDGAYDQWTMWVWNDQEGGKGYELVTAADGSEAVATYTCSSGVSKVGFIVKGIADWSKDIDEDREVDLASLSGDVIDVYITSAMKEFKAEVATEQETTPAPQEDPTEPADSEEEDETEPVSDDPNADYSASIGTVIVADVVVLLVVAALCFTVFGKKKDTMF